jgi:hypothetical protein
MIAIKTSITIAINKHKKEHLTGETIPDQSKNL